MANRKSTTDQAPRVVYTSPEGRIRIERNAPREFALFLDGSYDSTHEFQFKAEHAGGVWLAEQADALVEQLAAIPATVTAAIDTDGDLIREVVQSADLGAGLMRETTQYTYREVAGGPVETYGHCEAYALTVQAGRVEVEIDDNMDFRRRVHIHFPSGLVDISNTPAQLVDLAQLLRRDEVFRSLCRWAGEDAAADAAEKAGRRAA